jgi:hypothetical protein
MMSLTLAMGEGEPKKNNVSASPNNPKFELPFLNN